MDSLDTWLRQATRRLAKDSANQVRREIGEHHEAAREAAISDGVSPAEADHLALASLGDAKIANCQYRRVLLTSDEARMLREGNWEARALCGRRWLALLLPAAAIALGAAMYFIGDLSAGRILLAGGLAMSPVLAAFFVPINTPARGRIFRCVKWVAMAAAFALAFGPIAAKSSWLLIFCLWLLVWTEWTRASIRRKLPVTAWPRQLYL